MRQGQLGRLGSQLCQHRMDAMLDVEMLKRILNINRGQPRAESQKLGTVRDQLANCAARIPRLLLARMAWYLVANNEIDMYGTI